MINDFTKKEAPVLSTLGLGGGNAARLFLSDAAAVPANITKSLRFNGADAAYLHRTPSSAGNRKTWTFSTWCKISAPGQAEIIFNAQNGTTQNFANNFWILFDAGVLSVGDGSTDFLYSQTLRDPSAWYHIVVACDTTQSSASDRLKIYINGVEANYTGDSRSSISQNSDTAINSTYMHRIGDSGSYHAYLDAYLTDVYFIDGSALNATSFGAFDDNGVWQASGFTGGYGSNGFHLLDFANESTVGHDSSDNNNDFTAVNISTTAGAGNDVLFDVPMNGDQSDTGAGGEVSGNYCCLNPLHRGLSGNATATNGNLVWGGSDNNHHTIAGTFGVSSGKWYWEATMTATPTNYIGLGMCKADHTFTNIIPGYDEDTAFTIYNTAGRYYYNSTSTSAYGTSWTTGDVIGVRYDEGAVYFYKNGTIMNASPILTLTGTWCPMFHTYDTGQWTVNFGQRPFVHSAPTNHKPLCTALLPTATVPDGSDYFDTKLWTGNGSTQSITSLEFSPDWVWIKNRGSVENHSLNDTVRGANKQIQSSTSTAETTHSNQLTSFDSSGFSLGSSSQVNENNVAHVAWCWDAGSSTVTNTSGSVNSSVRANPTAGFSIAAFTVSSDGNVTVGHGLGAVPEFIIVKRRTGSEDWYVHHTSLASDKMLKLNSTGVGFNSDVGNSTLTNTLFNHAANAGDHIAYCFTSVAGYSAFGSYKGNGSSDGSFVNTGFRPALVLQKRSDSADNWTIHDSTREPVNDVGLYLIPNDTTAEQDGNRRDFLSNGFKLRTSSSGVNASGGTYIWAAFAENPFQSNGGLAR